MIRFGIVLLFLALCYGLSITPKAGHPRVRYMGDGLDYCCFDGPSFDYGIDQILPEKKGADRQ